jgi:hypothetical protein
MHHAPKVSYMNDEALIGITEAARQIGISHSTLSRQVKLGQVRSHRGKVRLSEVLQDRANNIDNTIWMHRKKNKQTKSGPGRHAVHTADDGAHAPGREFTSETVTGFGLMLDIREDRMNDPNIVGSVMALAGVEMILAELQKLGWRRGYPCPAADDDDQVIGPRPCFTAVGNPLDVGLVRRLGRVLLPIDPNEPPTDPNDPVAVAEDLAMLALDILDEEVKRRRVEAGQPEILLYSY